MARYGASPRLEIYTDGACSGNPGPGGWGLVGVIDDQIVFEKSGSEPMTTNNRMELTALIEAYKLLEKDDYATIYSDSELCVKTINVWADNWEKKGWKRKGGKVANLELVKELYALAKSRPNVVLKWTKGHAGTKWNDYADRLATQSIKVLSST